MSNELYEYPPDLDGLPYDDKSEKVYSTMRLVESLHNALENGYEELGATDIGDLLLMCETGTLLNPNHEGGRTQRAADGAETCDLYGCSEPAVVRLCASHYKPAKKRCSICGQSGHVSSDCGLVLPNPPRR